MNKFIFLFLSVLMFCISPLSAQTLTPTALINKMVEAVGKMNTYQFTMITKERNLDNSFHYGNSFNKVTVNPYCVYMKILAPHNYGTEIIYNAPKYGKEAVVNAGKFIPDIKLDPFGAMIRKDQHHTVLEGGFKYCMDLLYSIKTKMGDNFDDMSKMETDILFNTRLCYRLTLTDNSFSYVNYTLKEKETLYALSMQKKISEFLIVYHNKNVSDFNDVEAGKVIQIPTSFAKRAIIYIDKISLHPIGIEMYDEIGLFEKYEFQNVIYNPSFASNEFTKDFDGYGF